MPTASSFPSFEIPDVGLWDFLFERNDREFPEDKVIFLDPYTNRSYTYGQVKQTASDFGKGLKGSWEWKKGDVIALYTPNSIDTPVATWGALWAGGIVSPANPGYSVEELTFQLKDSGAKALITQWDQLENATKAAKEAGIPEDRIILIGDKKDPDMRFKHFTSIRNLAGTSRYRRTKVDADKDLAFLVYSSGTTGLPKGVVLSHRNIVANVLQLRNGESTNLSWKPRPDAPEGDSILAFLPFFHIYGLTCLLHQSIYAGYKCVVMPKFDIEQWCKHVQDYRITYVYVVPPVALLIAKHPCVDKYDLSTIRMMNSGAAPLTRELVEAVWKRKNLKIKQGYGLSETSPTTHTQPWELWYDTMGSVGSLLPNQTAMYMGADDKEVPAGEVGEMWIKGPNVFKGYHNNVEGTRNALTDDGYFKTGDVGYQDADGNFYITDRIKELIKYKGFQVPPAELEGILSSHEKIADVAVIGVYRDDLASEVPLAYVVPNEGTGSAELEKEIVEWLGKKVASHKKLRGGVKFTDEIPKSVSGKILRRVLKEKLKAETTLATPSSTRQQGTLGYWVPLITISTIAIGGLAAWIWSERSDSDEDDRPHHDRPTRPETGQGGAYPTQGSQPYPGPPSQQQGSGPAPEQQQDVNMPPYQGPIPSQSAGPQGMPPPVGGAAASYYTGRSTETTQTQQQQQQQQHDDGSWYGQVRGAIRRTPSPQQFFDSASKQVGAAAAAAGAALGSIIEEDKDAYYDDGSRKRERRGRSGEGEVFSDHERWSEEAEEKTRVGAVEAESGKRADAALKRSRSSSKGKVKSKKTVAVVVSADSGSDSAYEQDSTYQSEHASILSHLPTEHDPNTTELFVLIYAPTLTSLPPLDYQPTTDATSVLGSSYSQISTPVATPGSELQSISPRITASESSYPRAFDTLYQQALTLVSHSSHILPFTTQAGYVQILKHLAPQLVYVTENLSGSDGDSVAQLRGWVGRTIVVAGEGLADTETEDEGTREKRRWYERSSMVGLGKEVEVVDAARVGEDWGKRVGGRE